MHVRQNRIDSLFLCPVLCLVSRLDWMMPVYTGRAICFTESISSNAGNIFINTPKNLAIYLVTS